MIGTSTPRLTKADPPAASTTDTSCWIASGGTPVRSTMTTGQGYGPVVVPGLSEAGGRSARAGRAVLEHRCAATTTCTCGRTNAGGHFHPRVLWPIQFVVSLPYRASVRPGT